MTKATQRKQLGPAGTKTGRASRGLLIGATYDQIKKDILSQRLGPGVKLTAEYLANQLNVSRTPIRQALERLNQEGYVNQIPGRGFFVARIEAEEVRQLYDFRVAIETHALSSAMKRGITPEDIFRLRELNEQYQNCGTIRDGELIGVDGEDIRDRAEADHAFHLAMARLGKNELICMKLEDIHERLKFRRRYDGYWYWTTKGDRASAAAAQHRLVLDAIERGDRVEAVEALEAHIYNAWENYEVFLSTVASET